MKNPRRNSANRGPRLLRFEACEDRRLLAAHTPETGPAFAPWMLAPATSVERIEAELAGAESAYYVEFFAGTARVEPLLDAFASDPFTAIPRQTPTDREATGDAYLSRTTSYWGGYTGATGSFDTLATHAGFDTSGLAPLGVVRDVALGGQVVYRPMLPHDWVLNVTFLQGVDVVFKGTEDGSIDLTFAPGATTSVGDAVTNAQGGAGLNGSVEGGAILDPVYDPSENDNPWGYIDGDTPTPGNLSDRDVQADDEVSSLTAPVIDRAPSRQSAEPDSGVIDLAAILGEPALEDRLQAAAPDRERVVLNTPTEERRAPVVARDAAFALAGWSRPVAFEVEGPTSDQADVPPKQAVQQARDWGFWELMGLPSDGPESSVRNRQGAELRRISPGVAVPAGEAPLLGAPAKPIGSSASAAPDEVDAIQSTSRSAAELATGALAASLVWTVGARRKNRQPGGVAQGDRGASGPPPEQE
jgi:hypothetical protein